MLPRPVRRALKRALTIDRFERVDLLMERQRIREWLDKHPPGEGQKETLVIRATVWNGADGYYQTMSYAKPHPMLVEQEVYRMHDEAEGAFGGVRFERMALPPIADDDQRDIIIA